MSKNPDSRELKYTILKNELMAYIKKEKLENGDKLLTVREIMKKYRASQATVTRTFELLESENIIERHHGDGIYLKSLKKNEILSIGVILPDSENTYFNSFLNQLFYCKENNLININIKISANDYSRERQAADELIKQGIQGLIIIFEPGLANLKYFEKIDAARFPVISISRNLQNSRLNYIVPDNYQAGVLAAEYLLSQSCTSLLYLGNKKMRKIDERFTGFRDTLQKKGHDFSGKNFFLSESGNSFTDGYNAFRRAMNRAGRIDGLMAFHDIYAAGAYKFCYQNGIKVPGQIKIIGCDNLSFTEFFSPGITTIDYNIRLMAESALKMLLAKIKGEKISSIVLPVKLIKRETA